MERINPPDMNQLQSATRETSERTAITSAVYRTAVARLIVKMRLACSLPAFDTLELAAAVEAWCEILADTVPADRLNDCYLHAIRRRDSTFALASTEILSSWRVINAEESRMREMSKPCRLCGGTGFGMVYDPATDTEIQKECPHCFGKVTTDIATVN